MALSWIKRQKQVRARWTCANQVRAGCAPHGAGRNDRLHRDLNLRRRRLNRRPAPALDPSLVLHLQLSRLLAEGARMRAAVDCNAPTNPHASATDSPQLRIHGRKTPPDLPRSSQASTAPKGKTSKACKRTDRVLPELPADPELVSELRPREHAHAGAEVAAPEVDAAAEPPRVLLLVPERPRHDVAPAHSHSAKKISVKKAFEESKED